MLPANLAKTRAAGRGACGELLVVTPPSSAATNNSLPSSAATYRYTPYPLPTPLAPSYLAPTTLYTLPGAMQAAANFKRVMAATAAALRPTPAPAPAPTPALTYSMSDLLGVQGLDMGALYHHGIPAAIGL